MKKRSRNSESTNLADVLILDLEAKRARDVTSTSNVEIFSSSSSTSSSRSGLEIVKLLDECGWCSNLISHATDVYMYAGLGYCTEKCREWQYEKDAKAGRISPVRNAEEVVVVNEKSLMKTSATTISTQVNFSS